MRNKIDKPEDRLIVAFDFEPTHGDKASDGYFLTMSCYGKQGWVWEKVVVLAEKLKGTGIYIKVNSAQRSVGQMLISEIHKLGLRVFCDLKLYDIPETLKTDGAFLSDANPELLTVSCNAGVRSMQALKEALPNTEVLGVTVLTSLTEEDSKALYGCSIEMAVLRLANLAEKAGIDGLICSPKEAPILRREFSDRFTINTPGIRRNDFIVSDDDQNPERVNTVTQALKNGADRIVIGRPIVTDKCPYDAVMRNLDEIKATA